jgi:hypothetical protein
MHVQIFTPEEFYGVMMDLARKAARRVCQAGAPRARRVVLQVLPAAGRDDRRFLRQAQERHARLRLDGL